MKFFHTLSDFISKHAEKIILLLAVILSIGSFIYYYQAGLITAYGDSRGHLNIARRVVDSLTPGVAQLGGYWLPLLHVLMLPTIWNDFMWQSGLSGSIPNMIAFVIAVLYMYRLGFLVTGNKLSAFIAASVLLFNPNLLYMQATPMTESLFVCTITIFMFYFYRWFREGRTSDLVLAAIFLVLSSLNRYEGWGLVIAANVLMIWRWVEHRFDKKMEGAMIAFGTLSFFGIFLWLLWGAIIFHDPLEFMHNTWLEKARQGTSLVLGKKWVGDGDVHEAILVNSYAVFHMSGIITFVIGIFGWCILLIRKRKALYKSENVLIFILLAPIFFDILTVYIGKISIEVPGLSTSAPPGDYFNIRYALFSLPLVATLCSVVTKKKFIQVIIVVCIALSGLVFNQEEGRGADVLRDAGSQEDSPDFIESSAWFKNAFDGGLILASTGGSDRWMFLTGIDQQNFITEGSHGYWDESITNPSKYATWVVIPVNNSNDSLERNINKNILRMHFNLEKENKSFMIFKKIKGD